MDDNDEGLILDL